jgi:GTP-binding protein
MQIKSAKFVISNQNVANCPKTNIPEYAFIGRSNVGKSSLINMLTNQKNLAKTSSKPGKTQLINHFIINDNWNLVDLPGYGYAKVSRSQKNIFQKFITNYFKERKQLVSAFVLIDIRHSPLAIDIDFINWLAYNSISFSIIFTKCDKLKPNVIKSNIEKYKQRLKEDWEVLPNFFTTSSSKFIGREEILDFIDQINLSLLKKPSL